MTSEEIVSALVGTVFEGIRDYIIQVGEGISDHVIQVG